MDERTQMSEPQVETPVEDIEEPQGQLQDPIEETDEFKDWDKEKSVKAYRELQRKITEREKIAKEAERKAIILEEKLRLQEEQRSKPQVDVPKKPAPLPPKPQNFSMADIFDEATASAQWWNMKLQRDEEMAQYLDYQEEQRLLKEQKQAEAIKAQQQFQTLKNERVSQLQGVGMTLSEAMEAFDFINSEESVKPENIKEYFRVIKGKKPTPPSKPQGTPTPAGVPGAETPVNRQEFTKSSDTSWMYKTK